MRSPMVQAMLRGAVAAAFLAGCYVEEEVTPEPARTSLAIDPQRDYNLVAATSDKCVQMMNSSLDDWANIVLMTCNGSAAQRFRFAPLPGGYYNIRSVLSQKCIDVRDASLNEGAELIQYNCHEGNNEQWIVADTNNPGFVRFVCRRSLKAFDVGGAGRFNDGARLSQHTWNMAASQQFRLKPVIPAPTPTPAPTPPAVAPTAAASKSPPQTQPGKRKKRPASRADLSSPPR